MIGMKKNLSFIELKLLKVVRKPGTRTKMRRKKRYLQRSLTPSTAMTVPTTASQKSPNAKGPRRLLQKT